MFWKLAPEAAPRTTARLLRASVGRLGPQGCASKNNQQMWSWLPDELLQRIMQLVAERAPRGLAIFVLLDQRSRALAAPRLARMKPLLTAPFRLTVQRIFGGLDTLDLSDRALRSKDMEVLCLALVSGALDQLQVCWRPSAL